MRRILFVCLGNICRSPMAEGVFRAEALRRGMDHLEIDSAGTGSWHVGSAPDGRAVAAAAARAIDISGQRARQVASGDFTRFDLLLAMDESNLETLERLAGAEARNKLRLFLDFADGAAARNVPDPYYGGPDGFDHALDLIEAGSRGLADYIASFSR
ncbi:low molecular weight phosphotyrosine protein phosphatase [Kaustia mangrovi]|uniref:protein-tyrosine-phosphatase n=1 Tax=Kaustia mangrovi TaxID=2593653 RepID=A0A7S8C2V4_9HYPH|nr:low molecular weight protein-tyrosine-phosphatase [Kaustia mangrovi]QPC42307.1 low molecular weight phosphotyrosine protein phosphatase [Kaustia mangrovi]